MFKQVAAQHYRFFKKISYFCQCEQNPIVKNLLVTSEVLFILEVLKIALY